MNSSSYDGYTSHYPAVVGYQSDNFYNQSMNSIEESYSQDPYEPAYHKQQPRSYYELQNQKTSVDHQWNDGWSQQQTYYQPEQLYHYSYYEMETPLVQYKQQALASQPVYRKRSHKRPYSNSNKITLTEVLARPPLNARRAGADKKKKKIVSVISEEEKKNSTLWRILNEMDSIEELAMNLTGSRSLAYLGPEDVDKFEQSRDTNVPMPTDNLILNIPPETITPF